MTGLMPGSSLLWVGVRHEELDRVEAEGLQEAAEAATAGLVLAAADLEVAHFPAPVGRDADGDRPGRDPVPDPSFELTSRKQHHSKGHNPPRHTKTPQEHPCGASLLRG